MTKQVIEVEQEVVFEEISSDTEQHLEIEVIKSIAVVDDKPKFECNHCSVSYKTLKALSNHMSDQHDERNSFRCSFDDCTHRFKNERKLRAHMNRHEAELSKREDQNYYCRICKKLCLTKDLLIAHISTHNQSFCCDYCGKFFSTHRLMEKHILQHVYGKPLVEKKKILCELCSQFVQSDRLKRHIYIYHSKAKNYKCNLCGKEFKYSNSFNDHVDIHQNTPKYKCEYCFRNFFNSTNYKNHLLRHTNPDKFKCAICNDRFVNARSLSQHIQRKHNQPKEKLYCTHDGCDKFYYIDANLKSHIRRAHSIARPEENVEQNCPECKFSANSTKNLQRHMWRVHKIKQRNRRVFS